MNGLPVRVTNYREDAVCDNSLGRQLFVSGGVEKLMSSVPPGRSWRTLSAVAASCPWPQMATAWIDYAISETDSARAFVTDPTSPSPPKSLLILAFFATYVIWGTTYLGMRIAVETIPPFAVAAFRFLLGAAIGFAFVFARGVPMPTRSQWRSAAWIGSLLLVGGNGLVMWAMQRTPSGIVALIVAPTPLWMTVLDWLFYRGPKPTPRVIFGLVLGMLGIATLVWKTDLIASTDDFHIPSLLVVVLATIFWAIGALESRRVDFPKSIVLVTSMESAVAAVVLTVISVLTGETTRMNPAEFSWESMLAIVYLATFGLLIALSAYSWLLKQVSAALVSTNTFVNPLIAVLLGWLVLGETVSPKTWAAIVMIVFAVILIVTRKRVAVPTSSVVPRQPSSAT